jgi:hypothetical protein
LTSGGGSQIEIASGGQLNLLGGTELNLQGARLHNDGAISGATNVYHGSAATGTGVFGAVNVFSGGVFSPGASPGSATLSSLSFNPGGEYIFEIFDAAGAAGVGYDSLALTGTLDLAAGITSNSRFTVSVVSLDGANAPGLASNFNPTQASSWLVAATGDIEGFDAAKFNLDVSGFANPLAGGAFSLIESGNELRLTFTPVYAADFDEDGDVDGEDLVRWRDGFGDIGPAHADGDADRDGNVDGSDFLTWQRQLGFGTAASPSAANVPEPGARALVMVILAAALRLVRQSRIEPR